MDLQSIVRKIDTPTAQAFVSAARHVIDALLIEAHRVQAAQTPPPRDYNAAELPRAAAPGGWLTDDELHETARRLAEAIAAEKWVEGFVLALKMLAALGGAL
jgi:hypothetical protein